VWNVLHWKFFAYDGAFLTFGTPGGGFIGVASEAAFLHNFDVREQGGKRTGGSGFGSAAFAADQYAADAGIHGIENECAFHALLADDGCKGKIAGI
jgi:hypothetical protein